MKMKRLCLVGAALLAFASTAFAQIDPPNFVQAPVPVTIVSGSGGSGSGGTLTTSGPAEAGLSVKGTVGTTSAAIVAAGAFKGWATILNTHATQTLFVSFTAPATASDFAIAPGAALTLPFGPTNALNGIGSAAGTTFSVIGY